MSNRARLLVVLLYDGALALWVSRRLGREIRRALR